LNCGQRRAERGEIAIGERREQCHQHQMGHALDLALGRRRKVREARRFDLAGDGRRRVRHRENAPPRRRERQAGEQRRHVGAGMAIAAAPSFEHKAAAAERPRADCRTAGPADCPRQSGRIARDAMELGQCTRHGERELCARPESRVRWQHAVHAQPGSGRQTLAIQKAARENRRPIGVLAFDGQSVRERRRHHQGRRWRRRANAAKPAPQRPAEIEHAKMEARRGLDEDSVIASSPCHEWTDTSGAARM
jgi:hypothetical protein